MITQENNPEMAPSYIALCDEAFKQNMPLAYANDLFVIDNDTIHGRERNDSPIQFVWGLREGGTELIPLGNPSFTESKIFTVERIFGKHHWYIWAYNRLIPVDYIFLIAYIRALKSGNVFAI